MRSLGMARASEATHLQWGEPMQQSPTTQQHATLGRIEQHALYVPGDALTFSA
jgi:hypothetical protein